MILALVFLTVGVMKLVRPRQALATSGMAWTADTPAGAVKPIGAVEILGGLGLILPLATGIAPVLTPIAAVGLVCVMVGAITLHLRRRENFAVPAVLLVLTGLSAVLGFMIA